MEYQSNVDVLNLEHLLGLDSKGKTKTWYVTVGENSTGYVVHHGKLGGKIQSKFRQCKPKNVGRSNATTAHEQAIKEARAKYQKQLDKGYAATLEGCAVVMNPMLAMDYRKAGHRIDYTHELGVYVQPKLDGVRCEAYWDMKESEIKFKSRGGKFYPVPRHIGKAMIKVFMKYPKIKLDGELYIHGEYLQDIVSAVKKPNELTPKLTFMCFDIASMGEGSGWYQRRGHIELLKQRFTCTALEFVRDQLVVDEEEMLEYHDGYVAQGYEGVMIRQGHGDYRYNYRSPWLQKFKKFDTTEFLIIEVNEDVDGFGVPKYVLKNGETFEATLKGSHKERKALYENRASAKGKQGTVKHQGYSKDGKPLFPVTLAIRDYE